MNRKIFSLIAAFSVMIPAVAAVAQTPAVASKAPASKAEARAVGPTVAASAVGIRAPVAEKSNSKSAAAADPHLGAGQNVALMVVGAAAIIIGAIIGDTAGVLLAVIGAAVGLYGLYNFVQ